MTAPAISTTAESSAAINLVMIGGDLVYARAETTLVLYDFATSSPRRMDQALRAVLEQHSGTPVRFRWRRR